MSITPITRVKHNPQKGFFITLTFSDESYKEIHTRMTQELNNKLKQTTDEKEKQRIEKKLTGYQLDNAIAAKAVRLFLERW